MKKIIGFIILMIIPFIGFNQNLGMPGDNLNLFAVLKTFQESPTLEEFEENINCIDLKINNLDLDGNNQIDYINVTEYIDINDAHIITLQTHISKYEKQDIAVITVQKINNKIDIQIVGDEELYGKDYIICPNDKIVKTPNPGYKGKKIIFYEEYNDFNDWPIIIYIFNHKWNRFSEYYGYVSWCSEWRWGYYPSYFRPWNPLFYHQYYGYHYYNHGHFYVRYYRHSKINSYSNWYNYYGSRRNVSRIVVEKRNSGGYKNTYTRPDLEKQGQILYKQDNPSQFKNERSINPYQRRYDQNNNNNNNNNNNSYQRSESSKQVPTYYQRSEPSKQNTNSYQRSEPSKQTPTYHQRSEPSKQDQSPIQRQQKNIDQNQRTR